MIATLALFCYSLAVARQIEPQYLDSDDDLGIFPIETTCKDPEREEVQQGKLPECERTCSEPKKGCAKIYIILDSPHCFCKDGFVRNEQTNKCIKLEDCPKATRN